MPEKKLFEMEKAIFQKMKIVIYTLTFLKM